MDFIKKNDFIVEHRVPEHFDNDLKLFKEKCPKSGLHEELRRLNSFNKSKIHGLILMELLDVATEEEILDNRTAAPKEAAVPETPEDTDPASKGESAPAAAPETPEDANPTFKDESAPSAVEKQGTKPKVPSKKKGAN